ncbi:MAG: transketolase [Blastopirellula sp. JB062]
MAKRRAACRRIGGAILFDALNNKRRKAMATDDMRRLTALARRIRREILNCTTQAGSGHPTSSLSAVELMTALYFGGVLRFNVGDPDQPDNDRVLFSKGHASPLLYSLWMAAGAVSPKHLLTYREFGSDLEGHPTSRFRYAEAATGSLGQGLSIGVGMALNAKRFDQLPYRTYVLLGDSEMAEGSQWEAMEIASRYQLGNLIGILDVNRLGQRGETMYGDDLDVYKRRAAAFGWQPILVEDGHDFEQVLAAYAKIELADDQPKMIIARTVKGKGVSSIEGKNGWHGKALNEDELKTALAELGEVDETLRGEIAPPEGRSVKKQAAVQAKDFRYELGETAATRTAFGAALRRLAPQFPSVIVLDGEVCNSTKTEAFGNTFSDRFLEMYVAEQNMVGAALGLSLRGKTPVVSTFSAFLTRAFDQIRMSVHSKANVKFVGSHAGVAIGEDGPSQMGLEDIAMFRTLIDAVVLYPCDAVSTERLTQAMLEQFGIAYLRTTRGKTPVIYDENERFPIGGCKVLARSEQDVATIVAAGVTLHEALQAHRQLKENGVHTRVIDLYSVKPLDEETLHAAAENTEFLLTVEDHYAAGGIGEAVAAALAGIPAPVYSLAVERRPMSGTSDQQLAHQGISAVNIADQVMRYLRLRSDAVVSVS